MSTNPTQPSLLPGSITRIIDTRISLPVIGSIGLGTLGIGFFGIWLLMRSRRPKYAVVRV